MTAAIPIQLWILSGTLVYLTSAKQVCLSSSLLDRTNLTPSLTIGDGIILRFKLRNEVKRFILNAIMEDDYGLKLYELKMIEDIQLMPDNMEVTLQDSITNKTVFKVPWPPIVIPQAWTTLFLRLHYHHLLQLAVIPNEAMEKPYKFAPSQIPPKPTAISASLKRFGVTKLKLSLLNDNISIEYTVNCGQEFLATSFSLEFGIHSRVSLWRSMAWITLGIVVILIVVIIFVLIKIYNDRRKQKPNSFTLARFQCNSNGSATPGPVMVSSTQGNKQVKSEGKKDESTLQSPPPRITVGVVSSRAPSPGHETDEDTVDYVNKAFSCLVDQ